MFEVFPVEVKYHVLILAPTLFKCSKELYDLYKNDRFYQILSDYELSVQRKTRISWHQTYLVEKRYREVLKLFNVTQTNTTYEETASNMLSELYPRLLKIYHQTHLFRFLQGYPITKKNLFKTKLNPVIDVVPVPLFKYLSSDEPPIQTIETIKYPDKELIAYYLLIKYAIFGINQGNTLQLVDLTIERTKDCHSLTWKEQIGFLRHFNVKPSHSFSTNKTDEELRKTLHLRGYPLKDGEVREELTLIYDWYRLKSKDRMSAIINELEKRNLII